MIVDVAMFRRLLQISPCNLLYHSVNKSSGEQFRPLLDPLFMAKHKDDCVYFDRADVLITQPIEDIWRDRNFESISQIKWTNVGLRSGVFRTYPGHRSTRTYDPTK